MKSAFTALLALAILQTLGAILLGWLSASNGNTTEGIIVGAILGVIAIIFYGLAFWARKQPFPAALTGLVIIVSLWTIDAVVDPANIAKGIIIKVIILAVLIKAVQAGLAHRKLAAKIRAEEQART